MEINDDSSERVVQDAKTNYSEVYAVGEVAQSGADSVLISDANTID